MKQPLKSAIRQHVESGRLSAEQLAKLRLLRAGRKRPRKLVAPAWWGALAAAAAILLSVMVLLQQSVDTRPADDRLIAAIAEEVAQNHLHLKPLEVRTDKLDSIRRYFTRLDFRPVESAYLKRIGLELLGGRYCSLQGVTAAQLRFRKRGGDAVHTLYEVGYDPDLFSGLPDFDRGETPVTVYASGVKVTIWVEKGLLFALTEG